ncbi:MAG: PAQR family membrane homeostasis protein TrhA [Spirochaetota bacterium]
MDRTKQRPQTVAEEIINALTHGAGALFSVAGLVVLVVFSALQGDPWKVVSFSIYGTSLVLLYTSSTLHHSLTHPAAKNLFLIFDHSAIYLLIAGTYTPYLLVVIRGVSGWIVFGIVWGIAVVGIVFKAFFTGRHEAVSLALYLVMGWMIVFVIRQLTDALPEASVRFLVIGCVVYSAGIVFYVLDKIRFMHPVWHFFVLGGSICHFVSMLTGVLYYTPELSG